MGLTRSAKEAVLDMISEDRKDEARALLRTGEEIAVIFAKVSRAAQSFDDIAKGVDEEGAASFHGKWTVSVEGYGHASVGEHAPIQIAVENVASLDGDAITDNRLGSYTEFSARFKGRQETSYFTPQSILDKPDLNQKWVDAHDRLFAVNDGLVSKGMEWIIRDEAQERFPQLKQGYYNSGETEAVWRARLRKHTADQFKNLLPASRLTSMGVTWNGTEAEHALTKLMSSPSASVREIGQQMKDAALQLAPTLVKYADFNPYIASLDQIREDLINQFGLHGEFSGHSIHNPTIVGVMNSDYESVESAILAAFLFESSNTSSVSQLYTHIKTDLLPQDRARMFDMILSGLDSHDRPPRAFEFDGGYIMGLDTMDYGCWRDYKRHRMQSYVAKPMHIKYGYMIPPMAKLMDESIDPAFHDSAYVVQQVIEGMEELFKEVEAVDPVAAQYAVTRLHYRPAVARYNTREAFHLLRLRTGDTAHPFVRDLMWKHVDALRELHPAIVDHINFRGRRTDIAFP